MPWILLILAGLLEIAWAVGLKFTDGFTRLWPTVGTLAALFASIALLGLADVVRAASVGEWIPRIDLERDCGCRRERGSQSACLAAAYA